MLELTVISLDSDPLDWPLHERPVIYVAGYFSANPMHGTANAVEAAKALHALGWLPLIPHVSIITDMLWPMTPEFWYALDLGLLRRCDFMYVCPDVLTAQSVGVADEIAFAEMNNIPVLRELVPAKDRYATR